MANRVLILIALFVFSGSLIAQTDDPILFSVNGNDIHVSEFNYIYSKTNGEKADYSEASLKEYLDLYVKFKLKVEKAKEMKLDTIPALITELAGYRRQLADSYLIDREVTEKLSEEAYERIKQDVDISHIMISVNEDASPEDTLKAYNKAMEALKKIKGGDDFMRVARAYSDDKSVTKNDGRIGYVTALFPNGMYNLESGAYNLPVNEVHGPIRTKAAYHILKVNNRRPARGEVEVAHILIRNNIAGDAIKARFKIDSLYQLLENGEEYEKVARVHSHDNVSAPKGGYIGFFGINRYEQSFEDASFALEEGAYSKPIQTSIGWHILKVHSKREIEPYNIAKARLQTRIKKDARYEIAKAGMVERIKKEANFTVNNTTLQTFTDSLDQEFLTYKWKAPATPSPQTLFSFGGKEMEVSLGEFEAFLQKSSRKRLRMGRNTPISQAVQELYAEFVNNQALKYEERQLEKKYPEFKSLMREYEEGILLFEATKILVWDKASQDTTGLKAFFKTVDGNYKWKKRAVVSQYSLKESAKHLHNQIREYSKTHTANQTLTHFNEGEKPILTVKEKVIEEGRNEVLDKMKWEVGQLSPSEISKRDNSYNFLKVEELKAPANKTLDEARGYVVADYQDSLEAKWIDELRKKYTVKINDDVFQGLVK